MDSSTSCLYVWPFTCSKHLGNYTLISICNSDFESIMTSNWLWMWSWNDGVYLELKVASALVLCLLNNLLKMSALACSEWLKFLMSLIQLSILLTTGGHGSVRPILMLEAQESCKTWRKGQNTVSQAGDGEIKLNKSLIIIYQTPEPLQHDNIKIWELGSIKVLFIPPFTNYFDLCKCKDCPSVSTVFSKVSDQSLWKTTFSGYSFIQWFLFVHITSNWDTYLLSLTWDDVFIFYMWPFS